MSALIAAALATPVLVALYLLKLRRRPMRVSMIAFWEQAEKDLQANVPLRWIKPSWLLLLHFIILSLLILALGRPAAELPSSLGGASRVILLIDRSASMSATDGPGGSSRLEAAKEKAIKAIDELTGIGGGRSAIVVTFAADAAALTRWSSSRGLLRDAVNSIEPTDQPADLTGAMKLVEAIAAGGGDEETSPYPPLVLVYSDGSFKVESPIQAAGIRVKLESVPESSEPRGVGPLPQSPSAGAALAARDNLGIIAIAARRDYSDPTRVRVLVRIQNAANDTSALPIAAPLTLSLNGEVVERRVVDVPGPASKEVGGVELGSAVSTFEFLSLEGGLVLAQIGRDDALSSDNAASLVLARPDRPGILLYRPLAGGPVVEGQEAPLSPSDWLLEDALRELRPRMLTIKAVLSTFALDQSDLNGHDVVIFDRVTPGATPPMASLSLGVVPPGLGITRSAQSSSEAEGTAPSRADAGPVLLWERSHPLLRDVALDSLFVGQDVGLRVEPALPDGVKVTELARGRDRALLMLAERHGTRHVVAGFELAQSNWPTQVSFPIFLASAADFLTLRGESSLGRSFTTAQAVTMSTKPQAGGTGAPAPITLEGPITAAATPRADGEVSFGVLSRAGVYLVDSPRAVDRAVAVNLVDATESAIDVRGELSIGSAASITGEGKARREIWPWLVLAAAVLLFIEWLIYAMRMRA
jgi:von Willebrand factor type A domain/Aerotolerance regulator N-terminal